MIYSLAESFNPGSFGSMFALRSREVAFEASESRPGALNAVDLHVKEVRIFLI